MRIQGSSSNDIYFKRWLTDMAYGPNFQNKLITLPDYISQTHSLDDLISKVYPYPDLTRAINNPSFFFKSAILITRNDIVDELNQKVLDLLPGEEITLHSADIADTSNEENDEVHQVSSEYLETLSPGNFPPAKLKLKRGCIIMFLRNTNPQIGLCNGTRLIVKEIGAYNLKVSVIKDTNEAGEQIELIPRIILSTLEGEYPFILSRKQFPVKLSFAMIINKSQGQSFTNVGIDLQYPAFTHGQLYVALSGSTNPNNIYVLHKTPEINFPETENTIENIIYPELLLT
ncbi:hypothetical protein [Parasitella parasitica]|uniref:DNA helicase Pif1-like 2B domain-containing protein n=1 Tax=Parasitella parasitica TaxID=35722 RepID=A0A0B7N960_9FUNG|nr:hypothetical protein [Parasitella parasitica]